MTKEDLIGRKFTEKLESPSHSIEYLITGFSNSGNMQLSWTNNKGESHTTNYGYQLDHFNSKLGNNIRLLPEDIKMYKTPKGIEYGVGIDVTYTKVPYNISKIDKKGVYVTGSSVKDVFYDFADFNRLLDKEDGYGFELASNMKDYKQVDPKTITFDFTNTKIKVNNEEESKWIQEVAFNNGCSWEYNNTDKTPRYTEAKGLVIWDKVLFHCMSGDIKSYSKKEITIQDILNNMKVSPKFKEGDVLESNGNEKYASKELVVKKVTSTGYFAGSAVEEDTHKWIETNYILKDNMEKIIEVGDVVEILDTQSSGLQKGHHYAVSGIDVNGVIRIKSLKPGENFSWSFDPPAVKLVLKANKKEIIGYETVVDLPGIPKGSKSNSYNKPFYGFTHTLVGYLTPNTTFHEEAVQDTKFFKPIYKQDAIEVKFSKYTATLSKENGLVFSDGEKITYTNLNTLIKELAKTKKSLGKYEGHETYFDYTVTSVKVGCKIFTPDDVTNVSLAIKILEK